MSLADDFQRFVCGTSPFGGGFTPARAEGCRLYDDAGRVFLDFIAGIAVNNVGHCHPKVVEAVCAQARLYAHTMVYGEHIQAPQVELARETARVAPAGLDKVYFLTTGAEANDAALKMAVKLTGRSEIVAFDSAYHGDTVGATGCFGSAHYRNQFAAILPRVKFLPFGLSEVLDKITERTAAVMIEPVQGEAGIIVPPEGYLQAVRRRCNETGAFLIFDEVQTAFGRIGDWFAANHFGVTPDAITVAKGFGAGMPLAGVIGRADQMTRFASDPPFSHITTFGGHPVSCAAGLAGLRIIAEERLLENAREQGAHLMNRLGRLQEMYRFIKSVRGIGLMIGVEVDSAERARRIVNACRDTGLIVETTLLNESVIRISPPLTVRREDCNEALLVFERALGQIQ